MERTNLLKIVSVPEFQGVIIPDLPFDEEIEFYEKLKENGIDGILLVAPNTSEERLKEISNYATGFFILCFSNGRNWRQ